MTDQEIIVNILRGLPDEYLNFEYTAIRVADLILEALKKPEDDYNKLIGIIRFVEACGGLDKVLQLVKNEDKK
jgi:hypothetical protein